MHGDFLVVRGHAPLRTTLTYPAEARDRINRHHAQQAEINNSAIVFKAVMGPKDEIGYFQPGVSS
jgi:hypothetical protein